MGHIGSSWATFDNLTRHVVAAISPQRILDIGAGGGKYGRLLKDVVPDCELTALECDETAFPELRKSGYNQILPVTADALYEQGAELYDVVILGDVIEHMLYSKGRDLLEYLNYRARYIIIATPECMPQNRAVFFEGHNSVWRPDSFAWHDYWAHQQCGVMHLYLLRGHQNWEGPGLADVVQAVNTAGILNPQYPDKQQPAMLTIRDTRYSETLDGNSFTLFRPS